MSLESSEPSLQFEVGVVLGHLYRLLWHFLIIEVMLGWVGYSLFVNVFTLSLIEILIELGWLIVFTLPAFYAASVVAWVTWKLFGVTYNQTIGKL